MYRIILVVATLTCCTFDVQSLRGTTHSDASDDARLTQGDGGTEISLEVNAPPSGGTTPIPSGGMGGSAVVGGSAGVGGNPQPATGGTGGNGGTESPICVPQTEICNGKDDDCDGMTDDGIGCRPLGDGCITNTQCGSSACVNGRCCEYNCNSVCDSCNVAGRCIKAPDETACGPRMCAPQLSDVDRRSPSILANVCRAGACIQTTKSCFGTECVPGGFPQGVNRLNGCVMSGLEPICERAFAFTCSPGDVCNAEGTTCVAPTN